METVGQTFLANFKENQTTRNQHLSVVCTLHTKRPEKGAAMCGAITITKGDCDKRDDVA